MQKTAAVRPDIERDIRELAQAIATLEAVILNGLFATVEARAQSNLALALQKLADAALFQRDGLCPIMLERIAESLRTRAG